MTTEEKYQMLLEVVKLYADPDTYFATFIEADRPAGAINDDWGPHNHPDYDIGDLRPGWAARQALNAVSGEIVLDPDPDFAFLKHNHLHVSYYDKDYEVLLAERGIPVDEDWHYR